MLRKYGSAGKSHVRLVRMQANFNRNDSTKFGRAKTARAQCRTVNVLGWPYP